MSVTTMSRTIHAPPARVFDTVAHVQNFSEAIPHIVEVEFLSDEHTGEGTRFRETRQMGRRPASTELEVTEYEPDERVRLVSEAGGTTWDTTFFIEGPDEGPTILTMVMEARPHRLLARLTVPLFKGMVAKAINKDLDAVKSYCER